MAETAAQAAQQPLWRRATPVHIALCATSVLLGGMFATQVLAAAGFVLGVPIGRAHLVGGFLASWLVVGALVEPPQRSSVAWAALGLGAACGALFPLMGMVLDCSYDGQAYQHQLIVELARGWNPLETAHGDLFLDHYLRGPALIAASAYRLTGDIEQAKAFSALLLAASGVLTWAAFIEAFPRRRMLVALIAAVLALNPVCLAQLFSFYVDGQLGSLFLAASAAAALYLLTKERHVLWAFGAAVAMLAQVKFTGAVYAVVVAAGASAIALAMRRKRASLWLSASGAAALTIAIGFIGLNPIVTNTRDHGHPFWPLAGSGAIDIISTNMPPFAGRGRFEKLARSLLAPAMKTRDTLPRVKLPFTIEADELASLTGADTRVGGFGPLFGGLALLAIAALFLLLRSSQGRLVAAIVALVCFSALLNPECWWARYAPQIWLAAGLPIAALTLASNRLLGRVGVALCVLLAANAALVGAVSMGRAIELSHGVRAAYRALARGPQPVTLNLGVMASTRLRLDSYGIRYVEVDEAHCDAPRLLPQSTAAVCLPSQVRDRTQP